MNMQIEKYQDFLKIRKKRESILECTLKFLSRSGDSFLDKGVDYQQSGPQHPPHCNMSGERFGDGGPAKLEADQQLSHDDGDQDPGLST